MTLAELYNSLQASTTLDLNDEQAIGATLSKPIQQVSYPDPIKDEAGKLAPILTGITELVYSENAHLTFKATADVIAGAYDQPVSVCFSPTADGKDIDCLLYTSLPDDWDFSWVYLSLPGYLDFSTVTGTWQDSFFGTLQLKGTVQTVFSSVAKPPAALLTLLDASLEAKAQDIQPSLNYFGNLNLKSSFTSNDVAAANFFPYTILPSNIPFWAYIDLEPLKSYKPDDLNAQEASLHLEVDLQSDTDKLRLPDVFKEVFHVHTTKLVLRTGASVYSQQGASFSLVGGIHIGENSNNGEDNIEIAWPIGSKTLIISNTKEIAFPGFSDNFKLVDSEDNPLPETIKNVTENKANFSIRTLELTLPLDQLDNTSATIGIGLDNASDKLSIGYDKKDNKKVLQVTDCLVEFTLSKGQDNKLQVVTTLHTELQIGGGKIYTTTSLPDMTFYGELGLQQNISLKDMIDAFLPGETAFDADCMIHDLSLEADFKNNIYSLALDISQDWQFPNTSLSFTGLQLSIEKDGEFTDANIGCNFVLDLGQDNDGDVTTDKVTFSTVVEKHGDDWLFSGFTGPGQNIPIGKLLTGLQKHFSSAGLAAPDANLESLTFSKLYLEAIKGDQGISFECSGHASFTIDGQEVEMSMNINLTK